MDKIDLRYIKALSLDIGLKRVGVALLLDGVVVPIDAVIRKNRNQASYEVKNIIKKHSIETLIVGVPLNSSSEDEMVMRAEHFVSLLDFDGDIFYQDESGSTNEAKEMIRGFIKQKRDGRIDSICAKIILQRWLFSVSKNIL